MNENFDEDDVQYYLAQIGAYFALQSKNEKDDAISKELYCAVNKIRDYFKNTRGKKIKDELRSDYVR